MCRTIKMIMKGRYNNNNAKSNIHEFYILRRRSLNVRDKRKICETPELIHCCQPHTRQKSRNTKFDLNLSPVFPSNCTLYDLSPQEYSH